MSTEHQPSVAPDGPSTPRLSPEVMAQVSLSMDLSSLTEPQRAEYYAAVCHSLGLNPLTKPFEFLTLNNKLRLYALRDCADQLRRIHGISIYIVNRERLGEIYVVTARAKDRTGREDESTGAVANGTLKGEALANSIMKAETKAKRRVTLSIAGLGWMDEVEVETIPGSQITPTTAPELPVASHPATSEPELTSEELDALMSLLDEVYQSHDVARAKVRAMLQIPDGEWYTRYQVRRKLTRAHHDQLKAEAEQFLREQLAGTDQAETPQVPVSPEPSVEAIGQPAPQEPVREPHPVQEPTELYATKAQIKRVQTYAERKGLGAMFVEEMRQYPDACPLDHLADLEAKLHETVETREMEVSS
jgi:hypothetical protein